MARTIEHIRKIYPYSDDCVLLEKTIGKLINEKSYHAITMNSGEIEVLDKRLAELNQYYSKINCEMVLGKDKLKQVLSISEIYGDIDKIRIETETIAKRNERILIGIGIVLFGVAIILITNKK